MARKRIEVEVIGDSRSLERALGRGVTASQRFQRGLEPVARGARRTLLGMAALGAAAIKLSVDFDRTSSQMVGLAGVGEAQVERWKEAMLELAPVVGQAPRDLAEALYFISSSGVDASKSLGVLDKAARASAAGLGETQIVADAVTSAMNAYANENLSAAEATDILVATVREGKGEAAAIAPVLGNILPVASQLGVGFDEVGAAMASMTRLGFDAAEAATNIQATLSSLLKPAAQSEKKLKELGTSSAELRRMLDRRGLLATLEFLEEAFDGNSAAMARVFPNVRALRGVLSLVGKAGKETGEVFESMEDNTGALGKAFSAAAETDSFKFQQALADLQVTGIRLGSELAPAAASAAGEVADLVGFLGEHTTAAKAAGAAIAAFATAILVANTALKVYNSQLVLATVGQARLLAVMRVGGPLLLMAGAATLAGIKIAEMTKDTDESAVSLRDAAHAADAYRRALTDLNTSADELQDAELRLKDAELEVDKARKGNRQTLRDHKRGSIEAREAALRLEHAQRDLRRAEADLGRTRQKNRDSQRGVVAGNRQAVNSTRQLRDDVAQLEDSIAKGSHSLVEFRENEDAVRAELFAQRMARLAAQFGGTSTKAGTAALAVADLATKLGRLPTDKEINLVANPDRALDAIEAIRARASQPVYMPVHPIGPTGVPRQHGGPVRAGEAYVVGEKHEELFVPDRNGRILPDVPRMPRTPGATSRTRVGAAAGIEGPFELHIANVGVLHGYMRNVAGGAVARKGRRSRQLERMGSE